MSYNISHWKTKTLADFIIPLTAFRHAPEGWEPQIIFLPTPVEGAEVHVVGAGKITGILLPEGRIRVSQINLSGEGSGHEWHDVFCPAFKESTGILEAVLIWEGGDSVSRVHVQNGFVLETPFEL